MSWFHFGRKRLPIETAMLKVPLFTDISVVFYEKIKIKKEKMCMSVDSTSQCNNHHIVCLHSKLTDHHFDAFWATLVIYIIYILTTINFKMCSIVKAIKKVAIMSYKFVHLCYSWMLNQTTNWMLNPWIAECLLSSTFTTVCSNILQVKYQIISSYLEFWMYHWLRNFHRD